MASQSLSIMFIYFLFFLCRDVCNLFQSKSYTTDLSHALYMKKIRYANLVMLELIHFLLFSSFQLCLALRVHQFLRSPGGGGWLKNLGEFAV